MEDVGDARGGATIGVLVSESQQPNGSGTKNLGLYYGRFDEEVAIDMAHLAKYVTKTFCVSDLLNITP